MQFETSDGTLYCRFTGDLNSDLCFKLEPKLAERIDAERKNSPNLSLVFDLKDVYILTSAFLRLCVRFSREVGSKRFCVVNLNEMPKRVFATSGLLDIMSLTSQGTQFDSSG